MSADTDHSDWNLIFKCFSDFNKTNSLFSSLDNIETVNVIGGVLLESRDVPGGFLVPNEHLLFTIKVVYVLYNITPQVIEKW